MIICIDGDVIVFHDDFNFSWLRNESDNNYQGKSRISCSYHVHETLPFVLMSTQYKRCDLEASNIAYSSARRPQASQYAPGAALGPSSDRADYAWKINALN